ncbi:MAG: ribonuclease P [Candidatus Woesearchaeota archaeon]
MEKRGESKSQQSLSALQQIQALFDAAALAFAKNPEEAHRLAAKAHKMVLRSRVKLPVVLKRRYCRKCRSFWMPGKTVRVRLANKRIIYTCLACKKTRRVGL